MTPEERELDLLNADLSAELSALRIDYQAACKARDTYMAEARVLHMLVADLKRQVPKVDIDVAEFETCAYCGIKAESVCDSPPADICEQAINATYIEVKGRSVEDVSLDSPDWVDSVMNSTL